MKKRWPFQATESDKVLINAINAARPLDRTSVADGIRYALRYTAANDEEIYPERWWVRVIRSHAGMRAVFESGVWVNFHEPSRGVRAENYNHWGMNPHCDADKGAGLWAEIVEEMRAEIGERCGIIYIERYDHIPIANSAESKRGHSHQTLIAISADGERFAYRKIGW